MSDVVYLDTAPIIYSVEKHADYLALINGCDLFVANDTAFNRVSGLRVEILKDLI